MTWQYIAGFFDGEGCISPAGGGTHRITTGLQVSIAQKYGRAFPEIRAFLAEQGIDARVYERNYKPFVHTLRINRSKDCEAFLYGVVPYLIVKRQLAEDALRHFRLFPAISCGKLSWENRGNFRDGVRIR